MSKLTLEQEAILNLTAATIFDIQVALPENIDWQKVLQESCAQTVILQVFSSAKPHLPESLLNYWQKHAVRVITQNARVEWEHAQLHAVMTSANIPYVIMKGCASSAYYSDPSLRVMGDVDCLVSIENLKRTEEALNQAGFYACFTGEEKIHIAYRHRSPVRALLEVHWQPNGIPDGETGRLISEYISTIIADSYLCETDAGSYMVPSHFHHGLIMLLHIATHLINTGIGLRHLCDWAVFVAPFSEEEFCRIFEDKLKKVGLWRFAQLLTQLSVRYLGCPPKTWAGSVEPALLEALIVDIFAGGNFGAKDEQRINQAKLMTDKTRCTVDDTPAIVQLFKTMNEKAHQGFSASNGHAFLLPFAWAYVGARHFIRILTRKRPQIHLKEMVSGANNRKAIYKQLELFHME